MRKHVVLAIKSAPGLMWNSWEPALELLSSDGFRVTDARSTETISPERLMELLFDADGLMVGFEKVPKAAIDAAPKLVVIGKPGAGVDNVDQAAATERGIYVCNTAGSNTETVADHTLGMMLAAVRQIPKLDAMTRRGDGWKPWPPLIGGEIWARTLGIVGLGAIGKAVARRAVGFRMKVLAYDPVVDEAFAREVGLDYVPLDTLLARSDIVTVHTPLLNETRHLIGADEFRRMKRGAVFCNLSRGEVADQDALVDALRSGQLSAAGIDVFWEEPLPVTSPLLALANVVLTPHVGGYSEQGILKARIMLAESVRDAIQGRIPQNVVNKEVLARRQ